MDRIEFDTMVEVGGIIRIPDEYSRKLTRAEKVHVAVTPDEDEPLTVKRMRDHPFHAPGFKPLTRDEIYDRSK